MTAPSPPQAARLPTVLSQHGDDRIDDWYWLRERDNPDVLAHLEAENAYTDAMLAPTKALQESIFGEIKARVQETDVSAPIPHGPWEYYTRTYEGKQYALHCRRPRGAQPATGEQVLLDENIAADGLAYFSLGGFAVAPHHGRVAYAVDTTGGERMTLRFRDLDSEHDLGDLIDDVSYGLAWSADSDTCFYVRADEAMRPWQVWRHRVGTAASDDVMVFQENDERFFVAVHATRSGQFVLITSASKTTSEVWYIATAAPTAAPLVVAPRTADHEYSVDHHRDDVHGDRFLIVTNTGGATNFKLVAAPVSDPGEHSWEDVVAHRDDVRLEDVDAFLDHYVLTERCEALTRLAVLRASDLERHEIAFPDPVYTVWVGANEEFDTSVLRYGYTSLVAPATDVDYDLEQRTANVVKVQPVGGAYDPAAYTSARIWATQADGERVPLSIVHRRDVPRDGTAPALLYGYGSYEISIDATFRPSRLSLLDRGFVYAIAHVRGGGELGRAWYEGGRLEHKQNSFTDFIGCAEALVAEQYTSPARLVARGGSAGGLLMGAVANLRPDLFAAIVAEVPFVDVLTTMLDDQLPLTITEWDEWGDPRKPDAYAWMKRYSPYDNVDARSYPAILVTAGLNDPRVQYWEPAKWVAKLRMHSTSGKPVILRTELGAGHGGPSGRYEAWREEAMILAFVCDAVGIAR
ncbi:MAG: S9 family peptidase [Acidimicrobiia bacterium]